MKKTDYASEKLSAEVSEPKLCGKTVEITHHSQKKHRPIPRPNYTIEELLAKLPEPKVKARKPGISEETDTGPPVGREVW